MVGSAGAEVLPGLAELLGGEVPVDELPEGLDVLRPRVPVVDVVRVLPHVARQDRRAARLDRRAGVGLLGDLELAVRALDEERPAAAEEPGGLARELLLELLEGAEVLGEGVRELALRGAAGRGCARV